MEHRDTVWYSVEVLERYALPVPTQTVTRANSSENNAPGEWLESQPHTCTLSPSILLERARERFGDEFTSLFDDGDLSAYDGDQSRADMTLCHRLGEVCSYDPHAIDRLFRRSALMRAKWDERHSADGKTYGELTMSKVVRGAVRQPDGTPEPDEDGSIAPDKVDARNKRVIIVNGRDPHDVGTDMLNVLSVTNDSTPRLFMQNGTLVRVTHNKEGEPPVLQPVTKEVLRCELTEVAVCMKRGPKNTRTPDLPKLEFMGDLLARSQLTFPRLAGLTNSPVLLDDGCILLTPGYDWRSGWYYNPANRRCVPHVPEHPTREDAIYAARYLREHPFGGFPFASDTDWANTLAFAVAVPLRSRLGHIPLIEVAATKPRTGKTKLVNTVSLITSGQYACSLTYSRSEEEMRKQITAALRGASSIINFDNVESELKSASLTKLLTDAEWADRLMTTHTTVILPNNKVWTTTMNNGRLGGDLPYRAMRIALDAKRPDPWARPTTDFRCHPLEDYCLRERGVLLGHLLTLVRAYDEAGRPPAKQVPTLGGYDTFTHTVGGILEYAGVEGVLDNLEDVIGTGEAEWVFFLLHVMSCIGGEPFTATALLEHFHRQSIVQPLPLDGFPDDVAEVLSGSTANHAVYKLGKLLGRHKGTRYGDLGIRLEKTTTKVNGCYRWVVRADDKDTVTARVEELRKGADA